MGVIVTKKVRKVLAAIYEYPTPYEQENVYSIHFKDEDVIWIEGKVELYKYLQDLNRKLDVKHRTNNKKSRTP